jgi:hypothetical protein
MDNNKNVRIINNTKVVSSTKSSSLNVLCFSEAKKIRDRKKASQNIRRYAEQLGW